MKKVVKLKMSDIVRLVEQTTEQLVNEQGSNSGRLSMGEKDSGKNGPIAQLQKKLMDLGYLKTRSMIPTGYFGRMTDAAVREFQKTYKIKEDGVAGPATMAALSKAPVKQQKAPTLGDPKYSCIAISKEECAKIDSSSEVVISKGDETRCAAYMIKCLSQYNEELVQRKSNAWYAFENMKAKGSEKYNMYTSGEINWDKIYSDLRNKKINNNKCACHAADHADHKCGSGLPEIITNAMPNKSSFNYRKLELGDIVGMYYHPSTNKGQAFCQRVKGQGLKDDGSVKVPGKFTFNTHVGFVVAIKDGMPIILHNIGNDEGVGLHYATPANMLLNKNKAMITWAVSDNEVSARIKNSNGGQKADSTWYSGIADFLGMK